MNILHEEIRAIQLYMSHLEKAIPLEVDSGRKQKLKNDYKELMKELEFRLEKCGDYAG